MALFVRSFRKKSLQIMQIAYHASHEQFSPSELLRYVQHAELAGFDAIHSSDHFHPWSERQGQSGFSFAWIAAAMQATSIPFSMVCAPGQRYHPAIVAQAIATIAEMFPLRYSIELGSGEAINEAITGDPWPSKEQRDQRLLECVSVIRELLSGKEVSFEGLVSIKDATLFTLPKELPPLFCAAISEETSGWAGQWADGLITTAGDPNEVERKMNAFAMHGGKDKPVYAQYCFSFGSTEEEAVNGAYDQWRSNMLPKEKLADFHTTEEFDEASLTISMEDVAQQIPIVTDISQLKSTINEYKDIGIQRLILHNVNRNQEDFIRAFGEWRKG